VTRTHGGPDARGVPRWDFSTNANAAGPCPFTLDALHRADPSRYPDPAYQRLRERLGSWHGVAASRIVIAASASEFIQRITAVAARLAPGPVQAPVHAYGDYAAAARAHGREVVVEGQAPGLRWCADPSSPLGQSSPPPAEPMSCMTVLDAVYEPLRLEGQTAWGAAQRDAVFQLVSPNKALGLPGIRAAYAIAPREDGTRDVAAWCAALAETEPSWPIGAHGVALLEAWAGEPTQQWLAAQRPRLREWKRTLVQLLEAAGAAVCSSVTPFVCARLPTGASPQALRNCGVGVRDAASFGLPGWVRLSAQPPAAQEALRQALHELRDHSLLTTTGS
jgi:histidinol-phosphate aminotransferase